MSFTQLEGRWLICLAIACSQPDAANRAANSAEGPREAATEGNRPTTPSGFNRGSFAAPMRSPALTQPVSLYAASGALGPLPTFVAPYPRGAWRLAIPAALDNVMLWVDEILIRHDAARNEVSLNLAYWFSVPPPPGRTREQALVLAEQVASEAAKTPSAFAELARRYSENLPARDEGGELGGLSASLVSSWPQVLDALAAIRPGETSKVVETSYGFHIFRRREPPPEQTLSGAHVVIGHDRAEWLKVLARGPLPSRSRDEALALATELYRQARTQPERFQELVDRYSESRDAVLGGDFGSWSTREPQPFPPRMRRLQQLAVGEVGAPVETHLGFEVILRTEPPAREQYAVRSIRQHFNPKAPESAEDSSARVLARAEALAQAYAAEPQRFGAPGELPYSSIQWQSGRGVPGVELQLQKLAIGAVASAPVQAEFSFQTFQRMTPEPVALVRYDTDLPTPAQPDLRYHLAQLPPESVRELLRESGRAAKRRLRLPSVEFASLQEWLEGAALADPIDYFAATAAVQRVLDEMRARLGPERYEVYVSVLERELASKLLGAPAHSAAERGI